MSERLPTRPGVARPRGAPHLTVAADTNPCDQGEAGENTPNCDEDGNEAVSGVIDQISDEAADNGAPPEFTDGIDAENCQVVVPLEEAIEGGSDELPAPPAPPALSSPLG